MFFNLLKKNKIYKNLIAGALLLPLLLFQNASFGFSHSISYQIINNTGLFPVQGACVGINNENFYDETCGPGQNYLVYGTNSPLTGAFIWIQFDDSGKTFTLDQGTCETYFGGPVMTQSQGLIKLSFGPVGDISTYATMPVTVTITRNQSNYVAIASCTPK